MKFMRSLLSAVLVSVLITTLMTPVFADSTGEIVGEPSEIGESIESVENEVIGLNDLGVQLNDLYQIVGEQLNIDYLYVKIIHLIAGGKAVYADKIPNIKVDTTVESLSGAFDIEGAKQEYKAEAPWIYCSDDSVERPSKYYMPDAAYSVTADVVKIMNERYSFNRGNMQVYFDALSMGVKTNIIFCEAMLQYAGSSEDVVNSFYTIYEKIAYDKQPDENVLESDGNGRFTFKEEFKQIILNNGITSDTEIEMLAIILSFDSKLASSSSTEELTDSYIIPYEVGYTSRENMMAAAMSIVGKVRYVWGGGHGGSGAIDGINPMWKLFYNAYPTDKNEYGFGKCIKPTTTWCPIHGEIHKENGCLFETKTMFNADDYIKERESKFDVSSIKDDKYKALLSTGVDFEKGVDPHRLDGLDCSGYTTWLCNQVTNTRYDGGAMRFIGQRGIDTLEVGVNCLPGDLFSWGDHITVIVGPSRIGSSAYVMLEAGPNTVKFGVLYYDKALPSDINMALQVAIDANKLIGGLPDSETTRMFNMNKCTYSDENDAEWFGYHAIGRFSKPFIDENTVLSDTNKKIVNMTAQEIIQHTLNNYTYQYVTGINEYKSEYFNTDNVYKNSKMEAPETVDEGRSVALASMVNTQEVSKLTPQLGKNTVNN